MRERTDRLLSLVFFLLSRAGEARAAEGELGALQQPLALRAPRGADFMEGARQPRPRLPLRQRLRSRSLLSSFFLCCSSHCSALIFFKKKKKLPTFPLKLPIFFLVRPALLFVARGIRTHRGQKRHGIHPGGNPDTCLLRGKQASAVCWRRPTMVLRRSSRAW